MSTLVHKVRLEVRELIPVTSFFFVAFQLLALPQALIHREYGIAVSTFLPATLMAMIVSKVVVLTDHFRFANRCPEKPLIYDVVCGDRFRRISHTLL